MKQGYEGFSVALRSNYSELQASALLKEVLKYKDITLRIAHDPDMEKYFSAFTDPIALCEEAEQLSEWAINEVKSLFQKFGIDEKPAKEVGEL